MIFLHQRSKIKPCQISKFNKKYQISDVKDVQFCLIFLLFPNNFSWIIKLTVCFESLFVFKCIPRTYLHLTGAKLFEVSMQTLQNRLSRCYKEFIRKVISCSNYFITEILATYIIYTPLSNFLNPSRPNAG